MNLCQATRHHTTSNAGPWIIHCVCHAQEGHDFCAVHATQRDCWPDLLAPDEEWVDARAECEACDGTGECDICGGEGEHECSNDDCGRHHECGACDGTGQCVECHGEKRVAWRKVEAA